MSREQWLMERKKMVGASEVAAILGVDPWRGPLAIYRDKISPEISKADNEWMTFGRNVEGAIASLYQSRTERPAVDQGGTTIVRHDDCDVLGATLDRLTSGTEDHPAPDDRMAPLEIKFVGGVGQNPQQWILDPPISYQVQLQMQMACVGTEWGCLAAMFPGYQLVWSDIKRNDRFIKNAIKAVELFWTLNVEKNIPPPPDDKPHTMQAMKDLWKHENGETVDIAEHADIVDKWIEAKEVAKKAQKTVKSYESEIKYLLQDNTWGDLGDGRLLSFATVQRKGYTVQPTEYRQLQLKKGKK